MHKDMCKDNQKAYSSQGESKMMPTTSLQIYFWPCVTLSFHLLTTKVDRFMPHGPLLPICINIGSFIFKTLRH